MLGNRLRQRCGDRIHAASVVRDAAQTAMTWDQALTWFILPAAVALFLGLGGIWLSRRS
jgi:hypothetical protein